MFLVSMLHVTLQYTISIVNRKSNPTWHFDDKSAFTLITPLAFSSFFLAKPVSSTSCCFMSCLGRVAIKMLGTSRHNCPPPYLPGYPHS